MRGHRLPAVLLALALLAVTPAAVHAAAAAAGLNETLIAGQLRELLASFSNNSISYTEARRVMLGLAGCVSPPLRGPVLEVAEALAAGEPGRVAGALHRLRSLAGSDPGAFRGCSEELVYNATLVMFSVPTPMGLLPLQPGEDLAGGFLYNVSKAVAEEAGVPVEAVSGGLLECRGSLEGVALAFAAAAADPGEGEESIVLAANVSSVGLGCVLAAAGLEPPGVDSLGSPRGAGLLAAYEAAFQAPGPVAAYESLRSTGLAPVQVLGVVNILESRMRRYSVAVTRLLCGGRRLAVDPLERLGLLAGRGGRGCEPFIEAVARPPMGGLYSEKGGDVFCRALSRTVPVYLSAAGRDPVTAAAVLEVMGSAASYCAASLGDLEPVEALLRVNPFAPLDPGPLGAETVPPVEGFETLVRLNWALPRATRVRVPEGYAGRLLGLVNASSVEEAGLLGLKLAKLARIVEEAVDTVNVSDGFRRLGLILRAASLRRGPSGGPVVYYAATKVLAWALLTAHPEAVPLASAAKGSPLELGRGAVFTVPGYQDLFRWAVGELFTLQPPGEMSGLQIVLPANVTSIDKITSRPMVVRVNISSDNATVDTAVPPGLQGAGLEERVHALRSLAALLRAGGGEGERVAKLVDEVADALEKGDYGAALDAAMRLRELVSRLLPPEEAARIVEEAARSAGMTPEEMLRRLSMLLAKATGNITVLDVSRILKAIQGLETGEAGGAAGQRGGFGSTAARGVARGLARVGAESLAVAAAGNNSRVIALTGVEGLLGLLNSSAVGLVVDITSRLGGGGSGAAGGAAAAAGSPAEAPPPAGAGMAVLGAVVAAAAAMLVLAARWGTFSRRVAVLRARARLAAAERAATRLGGGEGARKVFAEVLSVLEEVYGRRGPSETHREYARRLRGGVRRLYWEAAMAYEEAWFRGRFRGELLERLRLQARRLRSLLGGGRGG